jgi:NTE family protein
VLSYVLDELARLRGKAPRVDVLSGTSVGAINACYLAAHMADPTHGVRRLVDLWRNIRMDDVMGFGPRHIMGLSRVLTGGAEGSGIFDVSPIASLVHREIPWRAVARSLRHRHLQALSVSTTEVSTGRTVIFMQTGPHGTLPTTAPPRTIIRADLIGPQHALASAAIPLLFPPVKIGESLYLDGGVRQNTPIAPALRLGATHVFAIGLSREVRGLDEEPAVPGNQAPNAMFIAGKVLNAFMLDHIDNDIELLRRVNSMVDDGVRAYGPEFLVRLNAQARANGTSAYRRVEHLTVRPTEDIGRMAAEQVRRGQFRGGSALIRSVLRLLDVGTVREADLLSYLLFDGAFASRLIDLGRADASARRDEILSFFAGDDTPGGALLEEKESDHWTIPPPTVGEDV